ncbi:MAG: hypothetical protein ACTSRW_04700 [Candidatus Helarchaeota archaeon]
MKLQNDFISKLITDVKNRKWKIEWKTIIVCLNLYFCYWLFNWFYLIESSNPAVVHLIFMEYIIPQFPFTVPFNHRFLITYPLMFLFYTVCFQDIYLLLQITNLIFNSLSIIVFTFYLKEYFDDSNLILAGTLIFTTLLPILNPIIFYTYEMGLYFFFLVSLYFLKKQNHELFFLFAFITLLHKETGILLFVIYVFKDLKFDSIIKKKQILMVLKRIIYCSPAFIFILITKIVDYSGIFIYAFNSYLESFSFGPWHLAFCLAAMWACYGIGWIITLVNWKKIDPILKWGYVACVILLIPATIILSDFWELRNFIPFAYFIIPALLVKNKNQDLNEEKFKE